MLLPCKIIGVINNFYYVKGLTIPTFFDLHVLSEIFFLLKIPSFSTMTLPKPCHFLATTSYKQS